MTRLSGAKEGARGGPIRIPTRIDRAREMLNALSRYIAMAVFVLAPLPLGSTELVWICIWNVLMAVSLLSADLGSTSREDYRLLLPLFVSLAVIGAVVTLQTWPYPGVGSPDPVWRLSEQILGTPAPPRISMTVAEPWLAFGYPLLFSLTLARAVFLAADAKAARQLLRVLAWAGCLYATYGILQELGDAHTQLFRRKEAYIGFATGTFVNRNTAATFWGSCALLFLVPLMRTIHRDDRPASPPSPRLPVVLAHLLSSPQVLCGGFFICIVATAMTGSRAGLLLSIGASLLAAALYLAPLPLGKFRRWGLLAAAVAAALLLLQFVGGVVTGRILSYGMMDQNRLAAYRTAIDMISDHPWFGIGLGNFETAFPAYRGAELGSLGIWDRAHSTPLELAVELGLPATTVIIATALWYFYHLLSGSLHRRRDRYIPIIGASVGMLGGLHSCIDFSLQVPGFGIFFAAITGCGLAQCVPSEIRKNGGAIVVPEL